MTIYQKGCILILSRNNRQIWSANQIEEIVNRNAEWLQTFMVTMIKELLADGRPLFDRKVSEKERLQRLLEAPPEFWSQLEVNDPESAAALAASVIKARRDGKIPPIGPRAFEVTPQDTEGEQENVSI